MALSSIAPLDFAGETLDDHMVLGFTHTAIPAITEIPADVAVPPRSPSCAAGPTSSLALRSAGSRPGQRLVDQVRLEASIGSIEAITRASSHKTPPLTFNSMIWSQS